MTSSSIQIEYNRLKEEYEKKLREVERIKNSVRELANQKSVDVPDEIKSILESDNYSIEDDIVFEGTIDVLTDRYDDTVINEYASFREQLPLSYRFSAYRDGYSDTVKIAKLLCSNCVTLDCQYNKLKHTGVYSLNRLHTDKDNRIHLVEESDCGGEPLYDYDAVFSFYVPEHLEYVTLDSNIFGRMIHRQASKKSLRDVLDEAKSPISLKGIPVHELLYMSKSLCNYQVPMGKDTIEMNGTTYKRIRFIEPFIPVSRWEGTLVVECSEACSIYVEFTTIESPKLVDEYYNERTLTMFSDYIRGKGVIVSDTDDGTFYVNNLCI